MLCKKKDEADAAAAGTDRGGRRVSVEGVCHGAQKGGNNSRKERYL